jgi:hypothetical protein
MSTEPGLPMRLTNNCSVAFETWEAVVPAGRVDKSNWTNPWKFVGPPTLIVGVAPK